MGQFYFGDNVDKWVNFKLALTVVDVLLNDSDLEGDSLRITSVTQGSKGTIQIVSNSQVLYTPDKNFKGSDSFSYTISDSKNFATATVNVGLTTSGGSGSGNSKGKGNK